VAAIENRLYPRQLQENYQIHLQIDQRYKC